MRNFTDSQTFKASVVVPGGSLPSDMSYGIASPATEMVLYWETYEEASQENGLLYADLVAAGFMCELEL